MNVSMQAACDVRCRTTNLDLSLMVRFDGGLSAETLRSVGLALMGLGNAPQVVSERLTLRQPTREDVEAICALANNWEVTRWMGRMPYPYFKEDALFFLEHVVPREVAWIVEGRNSGEAFGVAGLVPHETSGSAELGYWLGQRHWGKGFATEASRAILEFAFGRAFLSEVTSGCFVGNIRSAHVLEKLGFQPSGIPSFFTLQFKSDTSKKAF